MGEREYSEGNLSKELQIKCGGVGSRTEIYVDGENLFEKVKGIYGVEFKVFVDGVTEVKLYRRGKPFRFDGKAKIIEIFGEENYCLIDREYLEVLKIQVDELANKIVKLEKEKTEVK